MFENQFIYAQQQKQHILAEQGAINCYDDGLWRPEYFLLEIDTWCNKDEVHAKLVFVYNHAGTIMQ